MQVRRFSPELKVKIPGNHPGLFGVLIQLPQARISPEKQEALARRIHGTPLLLDAPLQVEMMYFDAHASIEEHAADHPILFLVMQGRGMVRIGGPGGETREVQAGEAILWPAHTEHMAWTTNGELHALVINAFQETSPL